MVSIAGELPLHLTPTILQTMRNMDYGRVEDGQEEVGMNMGRGKPVN